MVKLSFNIFLSLLVAFLCQCGVLALYSAPWLGAKLALQSDITSIVSVGGIDRDLILLQRLWDCSPEEVDLRFRRDETATLIAFTPFKLYPLD